MSFRASKLPTDKIKIQDSQLPSQLLLSSTHTFQQNSNEQILKKISTTIVTLHEGYLAKCRNIEIYRDLSEQEQSLLLNVQKNTTFHTALAGILAIDSCVKCIDKEEAFIIGNMIRGASALIGQFKALEKELDKAGQTWRAHCTKFTDALKYLLQQMFCIPAARGREDDQERQMTLLEREAGEFSEDELEGDYRKLLGELQKENEMVKVVLREKESYICMLQSRCVKSNKFEKLQQKRTTHSLGLRMSTEKSSQNQSSQHFYEEISHLKEELLEKNNIVIRMNEEFASQMEKYNSILKGIQDQNRQLKRYIDVDTAYLLEELQYEVEALREEKRKDQMIISDIQRKIEGISIARNSRINTRHNYEYQTRPYQDYTPENSTQFQPRPPYANRFSNFYSPNYTSRLSPYSRPNPKQQFLYCRSEYRANNHAGVSRKVSMGEGVRGGQYTHKSRYNINRSKQREGMEGRPSMNLLQRVMGKKM